MLPLKKCRNILDKNLVHPQPPSVRRKRITVDRFFKINLEFACYNFGMTAIDNLYTPQRPIVAIIIAAKTGINEKMRCELTMKTQTRGTV